MSRNLFYVNVILVTLFATSCVHHQASQDGANLSTRVPGGPPLDWQCAGGPPQGAPSSSEPAKTLIPGATLAHLAYANVSGSQTLDLLTPTKGSGPFPVVVRIHGGAFQNGSAEMEESGKAAQAILEAGYALASVNYRMSPEASFPAGGRDVKAAVRFLRANAHKYNLDAKRFAAWGESAGGYFAIMLGLTSSQASIFDDASLGNAYESSAVSAVVDWYGPVDFLPMEEQQIAHPPKSCPTTYMPHARAGAVEAYWLCGTCSLALNDPLCANELSQSNLISLVRSSRNLPVFVIAHGDDDCLVPWAQSENLSKALKAKGGEVFYTLLPGYRHADSRFEQTQVAPALKQLKEVFKK